MNRLIEMCHNRLNDIWGHSLCLLVHELLNMGLQVFDYSLFHVVMLRLTFLWLLVWRNARTFYVREILCTSY